MSNEIKEALELCVKAIEVLHPSLDPDEPCIAWEAHKAANHALDSIKAAADAADGEKVVDVRSGVACTCHPHDKVYHGCRCGGERHGL